jgi:16S rRNA (guanine(527)-N(7))-methyltransferase GidB
MTIDMFKDELSKLNIALTEEQENQLNKYYELLIEYNKVMNLTGITEKEEVYLKHFYDSLTLSKVIDLNSEKTLCDMGTGAGLPGIVLKIVFPNLKITLLDSLNKRIEFLKIVIKELGLTNIEAIHCRVEEYGIKNRELFDIVTARAVAATSILLEFASSQVKVGKYFIAMKGNLEKESNYEKALLQLNFKLLKTDEFLLPIEGSSRTLLLFKKEKETSKKFPRKFSEIKKSPL